MQDAFDAVDLRPQTDSGGLVLVVYVSVAIKYTVLFSFFSMHADFNPERPGGCLMPRFWLESDKVEKCLIVV